MIAYSVGIWRLIIPNYKRHIRGGHLAMATSLSWQLIDNKIGNFGEPSLPTWQLTHNLVSINEFKKEYYISKFVKSCKTLIARSRNQIV